MRYVEFILMPPLWQAVTVAFIFVIVVPIIAALITVLDGMRQCEFCSLSLWEHDDYCPNKTKVDENYVNPYVYQTW